MKVKRTVLILLVTLIMALAVATTARADEYRVVNVDAGSYLNARSRGSLEGGIVGQLPRGTVVIVLQVYMTGWARVKLPDGVNIPGLIGDEYFVYNQYLSPAE